VLYSRNLNNNFVTAYDCRRMTDRRCNLFKSTLGTLINNAVLWFITHSSTNALRSRWTRIAWRTCPSLWSRSTNLSWSSGWSWWPSGSWRASRSNCTRISNTTSRMQKCACIVSNTIIKNIKVDNLRPGTVLAQKFWGQHCPHQLLHHRVHFLRSRKPKKYELHIGLHLKSIISRVANSVMG